VMDGNVFSLQFGHQARPEPIKRSGVVDKHQDETGLQFGNE
jgi:hypothetical protein